MRLDAMNTELDKPPLFSIVLPVYGVEAYLSGALDDLIAQTYESWEAIIVDDCSPDRSKQIAERYAALDSRFRIVSHEKNKGLSIARNTGFQKAVGRYVWFPDPDDRYEKDTLQKVKTSLGKKMSPVVLIGHVEDYYAAQGDQKGVSGESENLVGRSLEFALSDDQLNQKSLRKCVLQLEKKTHYGYAWNKFYECSYLRKGDFRFADDLPLIEDIEFNIRVFQNLPSLNVVGEPLYHYAKRERGNLTNKFVPRYYEVHRRRILMLRNQLESWGLLSLEAKGVLGGLFARYILSALERNHQTESGMGYSQQIQWCDALFSDPLFRELIPCATAESFPLKMCLNFLRKKNARSCVCLGSIIHNMKNGVLHRKFPEIKSAR